MPASYGTLPASFGYPMNAISPPVLPVASPGLCTEQEVTRLVHDFYARVREEERLGPVFEAHVRDWPEHLAQLGEPFFRAPNQSGAGHGLGLAIARRAVERLGGHLRLDNHPEGGFIATLELPAALKA